MALCLSLAFMPFASATYTLNVFGNANLDDVIDENDAEYVRGIIEENNDVTELADANHDGQIDEDDVVQIESIISGDANSLMVLDHAGRAVTVDVPVERIIPLSAVNARIVASADAIDKVVGIDMGTIKSGILVTQAYPELLELPDVTDNPEMMMKLEPDLIFMSSWIGEDAETLQKIPSSKKSLRNWANPAS